MTTTLFVGLALAVAAPIGKDPPKKDGPTLVGEWTVESVVKGGKPAPEDRDGALEFTADGKAILKERSKTITGTYSSDAKKDPAEVDITLEEQGMRITLSGIYKFEKDTLTVCFAFQAERPKAFETPEATMTVLLTLKRAKKKD
jgi:uncharacterized protein (TIGR03067 family)